MKSECKLDIIVTCLSEALQFHIVRETYMENACALDKLIKLSTDKGRFTEESFLESLKRLTEDEIGLIKSATDRYYRYNLEQLHSIVSIVPCDTYIDQRLSTLVRGCNYIINQI